MKTIFATISSPFKSSVTLIRISGPQALKCLKELGVIADLKPNYCYFARLKINDELLDEAMVTFFQSPKSFTGEDVAEISVHSSNYIIKKIYTHLQNIENVVEAGAGEFSKRAFLNNKIDLVQAEAIPDLIASETASQHKQALRQLSGELGNLYEKWRQKIIEILAPIEALIDFPEDDLPETLLNKIKADAQKLHHEISNHLNDNNIGQKLKSGINIAIIGSPNVGKSSLINFLTNSEVAIVSKHAGTTRDIINCHLDIAGIPVIISDTAGIRSTKNTIENEGVKRALKKSQDADLKIYVIDCEKPTIHSDLIDENTIIFFNKIDKNNTFDAPKFIQDHKLSKDISFICGSITNKINCGDIFKIVENKIKVIFNNIDLPLITQERYRISLQNCLSSLDNFMTEKNFEICAENLRICAYEIGKINGKIDIETILDQIFSKFCIGK